MNWTCKEEYDAFLAKRSTNGSNGKKKLDGRTCTRNSERTTWLSTSVKTVRLPLSQEWLSTIIRYAGETTGGDVTSNPITVNGSVPRTKSYRQIVKGMLTCDHLTGHSRKISGQDLLF